MQKETEPREFRETATELPDGVRTYLEARRESIIEKMETIRKALREGDAKLEHESLTPAQEEIRAKIRDEAGADLARAEGMLRIIDEEIRGLNRH